MVDNLAHALVSSCETALAKFLAYAVEDALNSKFDSEFQTREYTNKAKTLTFNLMKNEVSGRSSHFINEIKTHKNTNLHAHYCFHL